MRELGRDAVDSDSDAACCADRLVTVDVMNYADKYALLVDRSDTHGDVAKAAGLRFKP